MSSREPASYARAVYDSLVAALKAEGQEHLLGDVLNELMHLVRDGGPATAEVTSALELTPAQRSKVDQELRSKYGSSLDVTYSVDPSLLGGLLVRVGDKVLDTSLRQRLNAVQRNMIEG